MEEFCKKISCSIWTQIEVNGNSTYNISLHVLKETWTLLKLINNAMFSKTGKQFQKQYKITSSQMFFKDIKSTFLLLIRIGCHVNRLLGWKPTIVAQLFICNLKSILGGIRHTIMYIMTDKGGESKLTFYVTLLRLILIPLAQLICDIKNYGYSPFKWTVTYNSQGFSIIKCCVPCSG